MLVPTGDWRVLTSLWCRGYLYWKFYKNMDNFFFYSKYIYSLNNSMLCRCSCGAQGSQPSLDTFQSLLQQHPDVFHPARTAKTLQCHWLLMKQYHLLPDQTGGSARSLTITGHRYIHLELVADIEDRIFVTWKLKWGAFVSNGWLFVDL